MVSPAKIAMLVRGDSGISDMKILNKIEPIFEPWSTPAEIG